MTYRLYEMADSGNCYKVRLLLHQLDIAYERLPTDILVGETRTAAFLAQNPNGKVPLLILPDGTPLAESNAMLSYLAEGSAFEPASRLGRAQVLQWLFFEQYSHEPFIATNRFWIHLEKTASENAAMIERNHPRGHAALGVMETHLTDHNWFAADRYTVADIALYAYTHVAHEGDYDLSDYPAVRAWLARVASEPLHIPITA